jgi:hypothetical protein
LKGNLKLNYNTTWADVTKEGMRVRKFKLVDLNQVLRKQRIDFKCPWCRVSLSTDRNEIINMGKNCKCGALLTDQGNAYKNEKAK